MVLRVFRQFLDRDPDPNGNRAWREALQGGLPVRDFIKGVVKSQEHEERYLWAPVVGHLYRQILAREPDPVGAKWFIEQLAFERITPSTVITLMVSSPEYFDQFIASKTPEEAVALLYQRLLGRTPSDPEVQHWVRDSKAYGFPSVVKGFIEGVEFSSRFGHHLVPPNGLDPYIAPVEMYYRKLLGRESDATWHWAPQIAKDHDGFVDAMMASPEYRARFDAATVPGKEPMRTCVPVTQHPAPPPVDAPTQCPSGGGPGMVLTITDGPRYLDGSITVTNARTGARHSDSIGRNENIYSIARRTWNLARMVGIRTEICGSAVVLYGRGNKVEFVNALANYREF